MRAGSCQPGDVGLRVGRWWPAISSYRLACKAITSDSRPPPPDTQPDTAWLAAARPHGQWLDHLTDAVFPPSTPLQNMAWAFKPRYWHWLQAGWVGPDRT